MKKTVIKLISLLILLLMTTLAVSPAVRADDRRFLDLSLEFLGAYPLPKQVFENTLVGGLSAIAYDSKRDQFYVLSDDRSIKAPSRFYTLKLNFQPSPTGKITLDPVTITGVTLLKDATGNLYPANALDPEGMGLSPRDTLFISTEGDAKRGINPIIAEFNRETGEFIQEIRVPQRFLLSPADESPKGVRDNLGFEALAIGSTSVLKDDPFRLFVAAEFPLSQDITYNSEGKSPIRWLHYVISPIGDPVLISERLYLLEVAPTGTVSNGLTELVTLPKEGYWLTLERTFGMTGSGAKLFEVVTGDATDTSRILQFEGDLKGIKPLHKQLLLDLSELGIELDNLEAMTLGPKFADGSQSLILVSDDNFNEEQVSQFLVFKLK